MQGACLLKSSNRWWIGHTRKILEHSSLNYQKPESGCGFLVEKLMYLYHKWHPNLGPLDLVILYCCKVIMWSVIPSSFCKKIFLLVLKWHVFLSSIFWSVEQENYSTLALFLIIPRRPFMILRKIDPIVEIWVGLVTQNKKKQKISTSTVYFFASYQGKRKKQVHNLHANRKNRYRLSLLWKAINAIIQNKSNIKCILWEQNWCGCNLG